MTGVIGTTHLQNLPGAVKPSGDKNEDGKTGTELGVGKDEFLKLLVAQLKNQDPLEPLKNEEFVAQLATFSSLEQLIDINKAVTKLADARTLQESGTSISFEDF